ncbi:MAG: 5,10-methylenetetrahydrofolate reductase [Desulfobacteraceae bacterium]|nr:MAG: 5,10-methylenetetrahydrofolate reductase [Desulfobacteraceae bacterium]
MSLRKRLASGDFVVLAEMDTPKGVDISELITNARRIKSRVDAVTVPDMDNGVMRMSAIGGAALMQQQGIEAVMHVCGRDRNRMSLQGDLLAANVLGVENFLVVRGEPMANSDHRDAKPVDDLDEVSLLGAIRSLREGVDMAGFELKGAPRLFAGGTISLCPDDKTTETEMESARRKIEAGAEFLVAPAIFDIDHLERFLSGFSNLGVPILATVFLLKSVGIARYISINEPGARVSERLIRRIRRASDRDSECLRIAGETIASLKGMVQGVKIETVGWEHRLPVILDMAGL